MRVIIVNRRGEIRGGALPGEPEPLPIGQICYQALKGKSRPCEKCPIGWCKLLTEGASVDWVDRKCDGSQEVASVRRIAGMKEPLYFCRRVSTRPPATAAARPPVPAGNHENGQEKVQNVLVAAAAG